MLKALLTFAFACSLGSVAAAQNPVDSPRELPGRALRQANLATLAPASAPRSLPPRRRGDSLKNGAIAGLIVGGVIGAILTIECGHPECGPYFGMSAGLGAAVGVGIDAMFTAKPEVSFAHQEKHAAPFGRGRAIGIAVRKRW